MVCTAKEHQERNGQVITLLQFIIGIVVGIVLTIFCLTFLIVYIEDKRK